MCDSPTYCRGGVQAAYIQNEILLCEYKPHHGEGAITSIDPSQFSRSHE